METSHLPAVSNACTGQATVSPWTAGGASTENSRTCTCIYNVQVLDSHPCIYIHVKFQLTDPIERFRLLGGGRREGGR